MTLKVWHLFALIGFAALVIFGGIAAVMLVSNNGAAQTRTVVQVVSVADPAASAQSDMSNAEANVRAAVPAIEAYAADNGTYGGASQQKLQASYDAGISNVSVTQATATTYCVESTVGNASAFKLGPAANVLPGTCP